jgi:hypothetical protein
MKEQNKFNDIEEFAMAVLNSDSETIQIVFDTNCTELLKSQIFEVSKDGSLQSAIREIGNWFNSASMQNFNLE